VVLRVHRRGVGALRVAIGGVQGCVLGLLEDRLGGGGSVLAAVLRVRGDPEDRRLRLSNERDRALLAVDTALGGGELVLLVLCGVLVVLVVICGVVLVVLVGER